MCKLLLKLLYIFRCNGGSKGVTEIAAPLLILKKKGEVGGRGAERDKTWLFDIVIHLLCFLIFRTKFYFSLVFTKYFLWCDAFPILSEYSISDTYSMEFLHETRLKLTLDSDIRNPYSCPEQFFANLHGIGLSEFKWWYTFIFSQSY